MLNYSMQSSLFLLLFWAVYRLFFSKETFFGYNRIYLLIAPILALVLPFLALDFFRNQLPVASNFVLLNPVIIGQSDRNISTVTAASSTAANSFSWESLLFYGYILGVLVVL